MVELLSIILFKPLSDFVLKLMVHTKHPYLEAFSMLSHFRRSFKFWRRTSVEPHWRFYLRQFEALNCGAIM
ncbi:unnamed protein product, partial [Linum tenue]